MDQIPDKSYRFGDFFFDAGKLALYHRERLIKNTERKTLQVLAVLLQNANRLTSHEEIIRQVWEDNPHGVSSVNIAQYVRKLRKILAEFEPDEKFIETEKGRGYMFVGEFVSEQPEFIREFSVSEKSVPEFPSANEDNLQTSAFNFKYALFAIVPLAALFLVLAWVWFPQNDENEIRRVVEDSQK